LNDKNKSDIIGITTSISGKEIRLTLKQWFHIVESHNYMAGNVEKILETVNKPDLNVKGYKEEFIALKFYSETNISSKWCVVVYKENESGSIITSFFTSKPDTIEKRGVIWKK